MVFVYPKDIFLSLQKIFLLALFVAIGLYAFFILEEKSSFEIFVSEPIHIEPIVIPNLVKEDSNSEILEKLKLATKEVFKNAQPSEDEVAQEVLVTLKALLSKTQEDKKQKEMDEKIKREKQKELLIEKEHKKRTELKKKALARKKRLKKERMLVKKREEAKKKEFARKKRLEDKSKIENSQEYESSEEKDNFDNLPFVETLGVINVSKPFTKNQ